MFYFLILTTITTSLASFYICKQRILHLIPKYNNPTSPINYYGYIVIGYSIFYSLTLIILITSISLIFSLPVQAEILKFIYFSTIILISILVILFITPQTDARRKFENILKLTFLAITLISVITTIIIVAILFIKTIEFFKLISINNFIFNLNWDPQPTLDQSFGIVPLFSGTILVMVIALFFAIPIGIFSAIYLSEYCHRKIRHYLKPSIELIAGIPTVVFGYFASVIVAPIIKLLAEKLGIYASLENALTAGLVVGIMITPYIVSLCDDIFHEIPKNLREASMALGSTKSETIIMVVLPTAKPGIIAAIMLAMSRAIGETMIVIMAAGLTANLTFNPFQSVTTITAQIVTLISGDQEFSSPQTLAAFALALSLFLITFIINLISNHVMKKFEQDIK